ncbi:hypothetical protein [Bradyrhizobium valentinum]|uniref:hypothetical protein n=1 Tax=Bradyrhizobium valentinum TaxID=1518501 RepID=UPI000A41C3AD|nr:hypothetical protein [Bradyrhizobium valentinum]
MSGIGRKIVYAMLVIVVLLIIWQFLGSLWPPARTPMSAHRVPLFQCDCADEAG